MGWDGTWVFHTIVYLHPGQVCWEQVPCGSCALRSGCLWRTCIMVSALSLPKYHQYIPHHDGVTALPPQVADTIDDGGRKCSDVPPRRWLEHHRTVTRLDTVPLLEVMLRQCRPWQCRRLTAAGLGSRLHCHSKYSLGILPTHPWGPMQSCHMHGAVKPHATTHPTCACHNNPGTSSRSSAPALRKQRSMALLCTSGHLVVCKTLWEQAATRL
jgi:hypothetical protein